MSGSDPFRPGKCPCGSALAYGDCCGRYLCGNELPQTAEQLMRSRYCAYAMQEIDYLVATTHPERRTAKLAQETAAWAAQVEFVGLEILKCSQGGSADKVGKVEFVARYVQQGTLQRMHEVSRFRRYQKRWMYLDGQVR